MVSEKDEVSHAEDYGLKNDRKDTQNGMTGFDTTTDDLPPGYFHSSFFLGTMLAAALGLLAGVSGFGYAAPILGVINADIGPYPGLIWTALVYTLMLSVFLTLVGRISDIFGRRWVFTGGSILGLVGSIVCAVATNIPMLIGGTTIIGIAASTQVSFPIVVGELLPMKYRFFGNALIFIFCIPGSGFGPIVAEAFVLKTSAGWRGIYYLLIGINGIAALCWFLFYHPPTFEMKHRSERKIDYIKNFDYIGTILYTGGLLLFLLGLSWGGSVYPWKSAHVISTLVVGFATLIIFVLWECFANLKDPLVPMHLFKNIPWVMSTIVLGVGAGVYYAFALIWPSMVAVLYSDGNQMYGGWLASLVGLGLLAGEIIGGLLAQFLGRVKIQMMAAVLAALVFFACVATCTPDTRDRACALVFIGCFFVGWIENVCLTLTTIALNDQNEIGTGAGVAGSLRAAISSISSAIYSAVLANRLAQTVPEKVPPALINAGLSASSVEDFISALSIGTPEAFASVQGLTDAISAAGLRAYKVANADAYRTVFLTTIAFSGLALILSVFVPNVDDRMTEDVAAALHNRNDEKVVGS